MSNTQMPGHSRAGKQCNSAAERNKEPILRVLKKHIAPPRETRDGPSALCLEISSGSGQHVVHFARHFPHVLWQPSEYDARQFGSIAAYVQESGLANVLPPIRVDVCDDFFRWGGDGRFKEDSVDFVVNINMMHISPFACTQGLFRNCGKILKPGGILFTYGPYSINGEITPASNVKFNAMLRRENPEWGLRDVQKDIIPLALKNNLSLVEVIDMPANNKVLVWKKNETS
ncbi:methyltransferase-like 26 [Bacillus rossius redtenbacheri]|uniref:methyltransferase-like 26 n=1 Tax=Bacillus rossius redtenbacheri TaxID=93214 RepID=UPI002FDED08E